MKIVDMELARRIKFLIYGMPNSGKTTLAYSALDVPELWPILALDFVGNPEVALKRVKAHADKLVLLTIEKPVDVGHVLQWIKEGYKSKTFDTLLSNNGVQFPGPFRTIIIDTFSAVNLALVSALMGLDSYTKLTLSTNAQAQKEQIPMYRDSLTWMTGVTHELNSLGLNLIFTAQEKNSDWGDVRAIDLVGQAQVTVPSYMNGVIRMTDRNTPIEENLAVLAKSAGIKFEDVLKVGQFQSSPNVPLARMSFDGWNKRYILNPTIASILKEIENGTSR